MDNKGNYESSHALIPVAQGGNEIPLPDQSLVSALAFGIVPWDEISRIYTGFIESNRDLIESTKIHTAACILVYFPRSDKDTTSKQRGIVASLKIDNPETIRSGLDLISQTLTPDRYALELIIYTHDIEDHPDTRIWFKKPMLLFAARHCTGASIHSIFTYSFKQVTGVYGGLHTWIPYSKDTPQTRDELLDTIMKQYTLVSFMYNLSRGMQDSLKSGSVNSL